MHLGKCREVGRKEIRRAAARLDVGDDASTPLRVTAMHEHTRAGLPELASDEPPDPVCRTGDECRPSDQLFHPRPPHWLDERDYFGMNEGPDHVQQQTLAGFTSHRRA